MKRLGIYVETSVWNVYFDEELRHRREATRRLFDSNHDLGYDFYVSEAMLFEIRNAPAERRLQIHGLLSRVQPILLEHTEDVAVLAEAYLSTGALPQGSLQDALHIAFASVYELDIVLSWNLRHIANVRRQQKVQATNIAGGYHKPVLLITPLEVIESE